MSFHFFPVVNQRVYAYATVVLFERKPIMQKFKREVFYQCSAIKMFSLNSYSRRYFSLVTFFDGNF